MRAGAVLEILESVYQVERSPSEWLRGVLTALRPQLDYGLGLSGYFIDASRPDRFDTRGFDALGPFDSPEGRKGFSNWESQMPVALKRWVHLFGPCGYAIDIPPMPDGLHVEELTVPAHGIPDMLGLNALDATHQGCAFAAALPSRRRRPLGSARVEVLRRIATHIATGNRLMRAERRPPQAVIDPSGRVEDAAGEAKGIDARAALRDAALRIDRARGRHSRIDAEEVTNLWRGLVAERWSLVDHFDKDGRRYFIAHSNAPKAATRGALTEREAQIVSAICLGHSVKLVGYELGIAPSSVATHLARAKKKLGVRTTVELIRSASRVTSG